MYYSASSNGFFHKDIHDEMPDDIKLISTKYYSELLFYQGKDKEIQADKDGYPILVNLIKNEDFILIANDKKKRNIEWVINELKPLDYSIELGIISLDERERRKLLMKYLIDLSKLDTNDGVDIQWPQKPD
ncbi:tail fiber assembly protein [Proteus appendicitidis]|uniref:Tail fiber assembly protein n=1 Tax=Proteus appendicitidis TaxID=3034648 RepID=A0ABY8Y4U4_9GAMM|nr:tail fiber assembly protein [Proteus sp. HZ0627]WIV87238.1 tail fiber assembly protein [Proteus sp. HZ0627]